MASSKTDDNFYNRADEIINLANEQCDEVASSKVGASLVFAASRFSAFIASSTAKDLDELKNQKDEAIKFFTDQYVQMLTENLDENIRNYELHVKAAQKN